MQNNEKLNPWHVVLILVYGFVVIVVPEWLIFGFNQEARSDWPRMLAAAIPAPIIWGFAISGLCGGIYSLVKIIRILIKDPKDAISLQLLSTICGLLLYPGVRIPFYWVKRIVFDQVAAFGDNPDNIYAVTGINSMVLSILWAFVGGVGGAFIGFILVLLALKFSKTTLGTDNILKVPHGQPFNVKEG